MSSIRGPAVAVVLFIVAAYLAGAARAHLDMIAGGERFREPARLPGGDMLKLVSLGFDQPVADALYIKSLIHFSESRSQGWECRKKRGYAYALFDAVTDLSPRFHRAYQMGAMCLAASPDHAAAVNGARLLEKGIRYYDGEERKNAAVDVDPRWIFHALLANIHDVNIQIRHRRSGDFAGASAARRAARRQYRLAALSPGAPPYIARAAIGYEQMVLGNAGVEKSLEAGIAIWRDAHERATARGDESAARHFKERLQGQMRRLAAVRGAKKLQEGLSAAGGRFLAAHNRTPEKASELVEAGLIPEVPKASLGTRAHPDEWLVLPDGSFRSRILADMETRCHIDFLTDKLIEFAKAYPERPVRGVGDLNAAGLLDALPAPPLAALGQRYDFDSRTGLFVSRTPSGPELSPPADKENF